MFMSTFFKHFSEIDLADNKRKLWMSSSQICKLVEDTATKTHSTNYTEKINYFQSIIKD